jgi:hypothetical protein
MTHNLDIAITWGALGTEALESMLCMLRITGESSLNFAVNYDVYFYARLGATL